MCRSSARSGASICSTKPERTMVSYCFDLLYGLVIVRLARRDLVWINVTPHPTAEFALAERLCRKIDRINPARVRGHIVVLGEMHLRRVLKSCARYYNETRTHRSLDKDAPISRPVQRDGSIMSHALLGGLPHHYIQV